MDQKNIPRYFVFRNRFSNFVTTMSFTTTILQWYQKNGRMLPWRQTRDPYAIWLSEIILQQTRIEQGQPYWQRFIERWPTVDHLAQASEDEVLRLWQGLGYYSRARHLLQAARQVVAMGGFPKDMKALRSLKGVGDYTAAAIGSIAFDLLTQSNVECSQSADKLLVFREEKRELGLLQRQCDRCPDDVRADIVGIVFTHQARRHVDSHDLSRRSIDVFHQ